MSYHYAVYLKLIQNNIECKLLLIIKNIFQIFVANMQNYNWFLCIDIISFNLGICTFLVYLLFKVNILIVEIVDSKYICTFAIARTTQRGSMQSSPCFHNGPILQNYITISQPVYCVISRMLHKGNYTIFNLWNFFTQHKTGD